MTMTPPFSQRLSQIMATYQADFYRNPFIQAMIKGEVNQSALLYYVQQDYRYLTDYLPMYEHVYQEVTGHVIDATKLDDDREKTAHQILLNLAKTSEAAIKSSQYQTGSVTQAYLNHLRQSLQEDAFVALLALAACPFDYAYLADRLISEGKIQPDNPFTPWVGYYRGIEKGLTRELLILINKQAPSVSPAIQEAALQAFITSTQYENAFFAQAMEVHQ